VLILRVDNTREAIKQIRATAARWPGSLPGEPPPPLFLFCS